MEFGDIELIKEKGSVRLLKVGARYDRENYCVIGDGPTEYFDDYDDALEEYNLRWLRKEYDK